MSPLNSWRAANLLIQQRGGEDAEAHAEQRWMDLTSAGDLDGCVAWPRIWAAIRNLRRTEPREDEAKH